MDYRMENKMDVKIYLDDNSCTEERGQAIKETLEKSITGKKEKNECAQDIIESCDTKIKYPYYSNKQNGDFK